MRINIILVIITFVCSVFTQNSELLEQKYNVLLGLKKLKIEPSNGLCSQIGMKKEQGACVQKGNSFLKLRKQGSKDAYTERILCSLLKHPFCSNKCCINSKRCRMSKSIYLNDENSIKISQLQNSCENDEPTSEELCKKSGLLWCQSQCCGFSSKNHKCFKVAHFGVPYVRCPIQASDS